MDECPMHVLCTKALSLPVRAPPFPMLGSRRTNDWGSFWLRSACEDMESEIGSVLVAGIGRKVQIRRLVHLGSACEGPFRFLLCHAHLTPGLRFLVEVGFGFNTFVSPIEHQVLIDQLFTDRKRRHSSISSQPPAYNDASQTSTSRTRRRRSQRERKSPMATSSEERRPTRGTNKRYQRQYVPYIHTHLSSANSHPITSIHPFPPSYTQKKHTTKSPATNSTPAQIYHSFPPSGESNSTRAILYITDIFGIPNPQAQLLADSLAQADYTVLMPDLFKGDAVPLNQLEGPGLNLTDWIPRHPPAEIDSIIDSTITYIRTTLSIPKIAGVGYCFGGKYVPRHMANSSASTGGGIDVGFIAHPSFLVPAEIEAVSNPLSIAAGELDATYNATHRAAAEAILQRNNRTYEASLYSGAPHGFAVKVDWNVREQRYAKTAAFYQALGWFRFWL